MSYEEVEVMKKTIIDAGLYIVEPDDLERLAEDTIDGRKKGKKDINCIDMAKKK